MNILTRVKSAPAAAPPPASAAIEAEILTLREATAQAAAEHESALSAYGDSLLDASEDASLTAAVRRDRAKIAQDRAEARLADAEARLSAPRAKPKQNRRSWRATRPPRRCGMRLRSRSRRISIVSP